MEILSVVFGIFAVSFAIAYVSTVSKMKEMAKGFVEVVIAHQQLEAAYKNFADMQDPSNDSDIHTKHFIKYLSDSRDQAYEYIDKVQVQLKEFLVIADKHFNYFDQFGELTKEYPNYDAMKSISKEYKKLKLLLPEESDDRR